MFEIGFEKIKMSSVARKQIVQIIFVYKNQELINDLTLSDCLNCSPENPVLFGLDQLGGGGGGCNSPPWKQENSCLRRSL